MAYKWALRIIGGFTFLMTLAPRVQAQEKLRLAWAGFSPTNSPIWVIEDRKLLQKQGVDPEIIAINASPTVLQALLANEIEAASISVTTLTSSRLAGADTVMIVGVVPTFVDHIVSLSNITAVEQLKGKTGGVNRLGTTSDMTLRLALRRFGIDPEKDTKIIATGENPQRLAALSRSITQFTLLGEPLVREAEKMGFRDLADIGTLKIPYHVNAVVTREKTVRERRPFVLKVVRAFAEALHFIKSNKEETKALIGKNLKASDPEGLERAYRAYNAAFPEIPYPNAEGVKTLLDDIAPRTPKAATADPKSFVDMTLVQELESAGFFKQLDKK